VEKHLGELREKAVVYLNSDMNGRGRLQGQASPSLSMFLEEVAKDVDVRRPEVWRLGPLGSGSDYVGFVHHAGIAGANLGFGGEDQGGIYHSIFDSVRWYKKFSDGTFAHGKMLAQYMAVAMARMSEATVPLFEFGRMAEAVGTYWKEVQGLAGERRGELASLDGELGRMRELAVAYEKAFVATKGSAAAARAVYMTERALALPEGLPGRPWYKSAMSAPGQYTGYGAKTLPGVREAIELGKFDEAVAQSRELVKVLGRFNGALAEAVRLLRG
jgi:N-acetylated-alpha-linked acidic dipeptidase